MCLPELYLPGRNKVQGLASLKLFKMIQKHQGPLLVLERGLWTTCPTVLGKQQGEALCSGWHKERKKIIQFNLNQKNFSSQGCCTAAQFSAPYPDLPRALPTCFRRCHYSETPRIHSWRSAVTQMTAGTADGTHRQHGSSSPAQRFPGASSHLRQQHQPSARLRPPRCSFHHSWSPEPPFWNCICSLTLKQQCHQPSPVASVSTTHP